MADKTINQFSEDTAPTIDDYVLGWDVGSGATKKITISEILQLLLSGGSEFAMQSWTPTWGSLTVGNGTVVAKYTQLGKIILYRISVSFGSTSAVSGSPTFTLPVTSVARTGQGENLIGTAYYYDDSTTVRNRGDVEWASTTTGGLNVYRTDLTYLQKSLISSTVPFQWATNDGIQLHGWYEAA